MEARHLGVRTVGQALPLIPPPNGRRVSGAVGRPKTCFVPHTWKPLKLIELVASMVVPEISDRGDASSVRQLLGLKWVMELPLRHELLERGPCSDAH